MKSNRCKNRNDTASQSIDTKWDVCPGVTSLKILPKLKVFMSGTKHEPPDRIIFASMFNDITSWESSRYKQKV